MSRSSHSHYRDIVVDGVRYRWAVGYDAVRIRVDDPKAPGYHMLRASYEREITPGMIAAWIRGHVSGHPTPPGLAGQAPRSTKAAPAAAASASTHAPAGVRFPGQPEIYALVAVYHWVDGDTGERDEGREIVACYADPGVAKVEASRLNAPILHLFEQAKAFEELQHAIRRASFDRHEGIYGVSWDDAEAQASARMGLSVDEREHLLVVGRRCTTYEAKALPLMLSGAPEGIEPYKTAA